MSRTWYEDICPVCKGNYEDCSYCQQGKVLMSEDGSLFCQGVNYQNIAHLKAKGLI